MKRQPIAYKRIGKFSVPLFSLLLITALLTAGSDYSKFASTNTAVAVGFKTARSGACAATLKDGSVLITGGHGSNGTLASTELFRTPKGSVEAPGMSVPRADHACAVLPDGRVLVAGGTTSGGGTVNSAEVFDPVSAQWSVVGPMSAARSGVAAARLKDGKVLVAGGESNGYASPTLEVFDPAANSFATAPGALSSPRMQHASVVLEDGRVLMIGGTDGEKALNTIDVYDPVSKTVAPLGVTMSVARQGVSAAVLLDGRVYIAGGSDGKQELASAEIYDPKTGSITPAAPMNAARKGHLTIRVPHNNTILIVGGTAGGAFVTFTEVYVPWQDRYRPFHGAAANSEKTSSGRSAKVVLAESTVAPTLVTDKDDYSPGEIANISGSGWMPDAEVTLLLTREPQTLDPTTWTTQVNEIGEFSTTYQVQPEDLGVTFTLTATAGSGNTAQIQTAVFADKGSTRIQTSSMSPAAGSCSAQITVYATLQYKSGSDWVGLPGQTLTFNLGPEHATGTTGSSGEATATLTVPSGATSLAASFAGDTTYNATSSNVGFTVQGSCSRPTGLAVSEGTGDYGSTTTLSATLTSNGSGVSGKTVAFTLNGTGVGAATTGTSGVATLSNVSLSGINAGTYASAVGASFAGDSSYSASSGTGTLTVNRASQTITFAPLATKTYGDTDFTISATASSGLPVSLAATANCTVSGSTVRLTGAGSCTITATQAGDSNYSAAPQVSRSFSIDKATATVVLGDLTQTYTGSPLMRSQHYPSRSDRHVQCHSTKRCGIVPGNRDCVRLELSGLCHWDLHHQQGVLHDHIDLWRRTVHLQRRPDHTLHGFGQRRRTQPACFGDLHQ